MKARMAIGRKGFTLVELMVVVSILAVLMAIVVPAVGGTKEQSVEGQVKSDGDAVGKGVSNFNNKSIKPAFPEASLLDHAAIANNRYEDILEVGTAGTKGQNVKLYRDIAAFDAAALDGPTGLRACVPGTSDTAPCELLSRQITKPGTAIDVDRRTILNFFANTDTYDSDGSVKKVGFVPDFISKEPSSLPLKADETKALGQAGNTYEEYLWVLLVNAPGSSQESRTLQVYRLWEALCEGADAGTVATKAECESSSLVTGEIKELNFVRVF